MPPSIQQPLFKTPNPNTPSGDLLNKNKKTNTLKIYYQNINGAKTNKNWNNWNERFKWIKDNQCDVTLLTETNTQWNDKNNSQAYSHIKRHIKLSYLTTSKEYSNIISDYLPGGTASTIHNKWIGRKGENIDDPTNMGRWSGFVLNAKGNRKIVFLSGYRPTACSDMSNNTAYGRQWRQLTMNNKHQPEPRQQVLTDLTKYINLW
jgi:hypothetical protein